MAPPRYSVLPEVKVHGTPFRIGRSRVRREAQPVQQGAAMPLVDIETLKTVERLPGWRGRYVHSETMTFAHYEFDSNATIHEHFHPEEEVYEVIEGELEIVIDGVPHIARPGLVAIVPSNARHFVRALSNGRVIVIDHPSRPDFG